MLIVGIYAGISLSLILFAGARLQTRDGTYVMSNSSYKFTKYLCSRALAARAVSIFYLICLLIEVTTNLVKYRLSNRVSLHNLRQNWIYNPMERCLSRIPPDFGE
jgi:hypothetical protein